ncbi:MAG: MYXO-CTERM sorting domain-containing protein, partial [Myxococcales bacterium]
LTAPETDRCAESCDRGVCPKSECVTAEKPVTPPAPTEPEGCGCSATGGHEAALLVGLLGWWAGRRRRARE